MVSITALLAVVTGLCSCGGRPTDGDADGDADGDGDADTDADGDGDADTDADGDGDADTDADGDEDRGDCVATETVEVTCNQLDDDCDGEVDDVDLEGDGICDCLGVLLLGSAGSHPSSSFEQWLRNNGTTVTRRLDSSGWPLAAMELVGIDVVILDRLSRDSTAEEIQVLHDFVGAGGGLVSMTGYDWSGADAMRPNGIIEGLGATYDATSQVQDQETWWDETHPIAEGVGNVRCIGGYYVVPVDGFETAVVSRESEGGTPLGVAVEVDDGRVFVWGDEWIEYDSEWSAIPGVPRLWVNLFGWLVQNRCDVTIY